MLFNEILIASTLALVVILSQFYFFFKTKKECKNLSNLFPEKHDEFGQDILKISPTVIDPVSKDYIEFIDSEESMTVNLIDVNNNVSISKSFREILDGTNKYLRNNVETTAEFNILKDIAERISDSDENKISATVSLPLYIGLMGTFVGVIFGILNIIFSKDGIDNSIITEQSIQAFLSGVLIAMLGSFVGLLLTTFNNSYSLKKARAEKDTRKNQYYNFLQVELLPTLENSLSKSLRSFKENLVLFNEEFSVNIGEFKGTIPKISENLKQQTQLIREFRNFDFAELAKANVKIFDKLNKSTALFENFNNYVNTLNVSLSKSDEFLEKIISLLNRFTEFENHIKDVGTLIKETEKNYGIIGETMMQHLYSLKQRYDLITDLVNKSEDEIKDIALSFNTRIQVLSQNLEKKIDEVFNFSPTNNPFLKLELLESINKTLKDILLKDQRQTNNLTVPEEFIDAIESLKSSINSLKKSIRPSVFRPKEFFKFIFSNNNNKI